MATPRISDAAVRARTGKTWQEWFEALDAAGARAMRHPEIVALLRQQFGVSDWWGQMVAVGYEQAVLGRDRHQRSDGYQISASKTIKAPLERLYQAWTDETFRARWLPETPLAIRKATASRSLRLTWTDGRTSVEVLFSSKGHVRSQVAVQHGKLENAQQAAEMKDYWAERLAELKRLLED